jgi:hypothetical protein
MPYFVSRLAKQTSYTKWNFISFSKTVSNFNKKGSSNLGNY